VKRSEIGVVFGASVTVLILLTVVLFREFSTGVLVGPLPWDDCAIVAQALDRLAIISGGKSLLGITLQARSLAPHSPVADIQTMLGLLISGGATWGPYALNGVSVLGAALTVGLVANARRGLLAAASLLTILLIQPLTIFSLMALKADWKSGLFFAAATYLLFEATASRSRSLWTLGSAFLGLAILCKLTAFYLPVLALGILVLFWLCELRAKRADITSAPAFVSTAAAEGWAQRKELLRLAAICLLPFLLFFLWGSVSYYNIISYIRGALSPTWNDGLNYAQRVAFYGPFSNAAWGLAAIEAPLLVLAAVVRSWRRAPLVVHVLGATSLVTLAFFALLIIARNGDIEFSGSFLGLVLGMAMISAAALSERAWPAALVLATALGFAVFTPLAGFDVVLVQKEPPVSAEDRRAAGRSLSMAVDDIIRLQGEAPVLAEFMFEDSVAGFPNVGIEYARRTGRRIAVDRIDDLPAKPAQLASRDQAIFLLVLKPRNAHAGFRPEPRMAATADLVGTEQYVRSLAGFRQVAQYPWKNADLELFMRPPSAGPAAPENRPPSAP
jgi:hypothetical protein